MTQKKTKQDFFSHISTQLRDSIEKFHSDFTDSSPADGEDDRVSFLDASLSFVDAIRSLLHNSHERRRNEVM